MHKKKRSQVTLYMILGIIILFVAILFFYLRGTTEKKISMQELVTAQKIPREVRPITNYITTQLDDAAKKGLYLAGMQGGYIYASQGVLSIPDPAEEGRDFIYYQGHNVSYDIHKLGIDKHNSYFYKPRYYPWYYYPYRNLLNLKSGECSFGGFFGTTNLPPLNGSGNSIQSQLTEFITSYLQDNINLTIFEEQGFEISHGEINVSVIIGENDVTAFLEYPLGIRKKSENIITNVSYFYTNPKVRLKKVYNFTDFIINKDITDILFDINNPNNDKDGISIGKIENAYDYDDIIIISDNKSVLYAEPYTFQFARENRYPALRYIAIPKITFFGIQAIMNAKITKDRINPKADDPDEDGIIFSYSPNLPYPVTQSDFDRGYVILTVHAKEKDNPDPDYRDWQELKIDVIGESEV